MIRFNRVFLGFYLAASLAQAAQEQPQLALSENLSCKLHYWVLDSEGHGHSVLVPEKDISPSAVVSWLSNKSKMDLSVTLKFQNDEVSYQGPGFTTDPSASNPQLRFNFEMPAYGKLDGANIEKLLLECTPYRADKR